MTGQALLITDGRRGRHAGAPARARRVPRRAAAGEDELRRAAVRVPRRDRPVGRRELGRAVGPRTSALAREAGALTVLPLALEMHCASQVIAGEFAAAQALLDEADAIAEATGSAPLHDAALLLAGWRGDEAGRDRARSRPRSRDATERGEESTITRRRVRGRGALQRARPPRGRARRGPAVVRAPPGEGVRRGRWSRSSRRRARSGERELAAGALERLREATTLSGTDWALGIEARSRALLASGEEAERLYREAIERLGRTRVRVELARAHLLYGEWLRRERRRRRRPRRSCAPRTSCSRRWAPRRSPTAPRASCWPPARRPASAASRRATSSPRRRRRSPGSRATGLSNPEIGARLFISPRTVQYHLHKVFAKLDISSRTELDRVLAGDHGAAV